MTKCPITTPEELRIITERDDKAMILNSKLWPWRSILPLVNQSKVCPFTGQPGMPGMILKGEPTTVYVGLMFLGPTGQAFSYASVDELLSAGWHVD